MERSHYEEVLDNLHQMNETPFHADSEDFGPLFQALQATNASEDLPDIQRITNSLHQLKEATQTFRNDAFTGIMRAKNTKPRPQAVTFL